ncbi:SEC7 domain-containing protein [Plasmodiophora brassicae]|uniref:Uncharacterized protein n=1 Tax=Plasmodiophora brassicae TaxID=37360 RepID=A0A0G4IKZ9_PLABS|nr:hypothetical protein PBRA_004480 [Plasmodiophora brassicae]
MNDAPPYVLDRMNRIVPLETTIMAPTVRPKRASLPLSGRSSRAASQELYAVSDPILVSDDSTIIVTPLGAEEGSSNDPSSKSDGGNPSKRSSLENLVPIMLEPRGMAKAMKLLGIRSDAVDRSKCLRVLGMTEDDYQASVEVFQLFNKIDASKSGVSASTKAQSHLGLDGRSLKLKKPFQRLGIDSGDLDRERMVALSLLGGGHDHLLNVIEPYEGGDSRSGPTQLFCSCTGTRD